MRTILLLGVIALAGCVSAPIISNPGGGGGTRGDVTALSKLLEGKKKAVVFFIHGVGDHCPGYALDGSNDSWLNPKNLAELGWKPVDRPAYTDIPDSEFLPGHPYDSNSMVTVGIRDYVPISGGIPIEAVEITWSQLTQWIKTTQLGYDLTKSTPMPSTQYENCPFQSERHNYKKPPTREALNRMLKEEVLDRSLADAVLYAGAYGRVMRRGIAEALCVALQRNRNTGYESHPCHWPSVPQGNEYNQTAFFFVTHSLGSRLIYDTLLGLRGKDVTRNTGTFDSAEIKEAGPFVDYLIAQTGAIYMMANQLPLLGLAYEDGTQTSPQPPAPAAPPPPPPTSPKGHVVHLAAVEQPLPFAPQRIKTRSVSASNAEPLFKTDTRNLAAARAGLITPQSEVPSRQAEGSFVNPPVTKASDKTGPTTFAAVRLKLAVMHGELTPRPLTIVAFSDTNDLLSWGIPKWYQDVRGDADGVGQSVQFTNVFVQTAPRWAGEVENPAAAHEGYFANAAIWQIIRCGASKGRMNTCR